MRSVDLKGFGEWHEWPRVAIRNAPLKCGIYAFRIAGGKCFQRLKGESDLAYIGATPKNTIHNRLIHHKSSCLDKQYLLARIQSHLGVLEVAWKECANPKDAETQECILLTNYSLDHIELPPANRQQSFKKLSAVLSYYATATPEERVQFDARIKLGSESGHKDQQSDQ